jgi:hypothetical protein
MKENPSSEKIYHPSLKDRLFDVSSTLGFSEYYERRSVPRDWLLLARKIFLERDNIIFFTQEAMNAVQTGEYDLFWTLWSKRNQNWGGKVMYTRPEFDSKKHGSHFVELHLPESRKL